MRRWVIRTSRRSGHVGRDKARRFFRELDHKYAAIANSLPRRSRTETVGIAHWEWGLPLASAEHRSLKRRLLHGGGLELTQVNIVDPHVDVRLRCIGARIDFDIAGKFSLIEHER
jgi:hypothetical protein